MNASADTLPLVIAGPILRHVHSQLVTLWLVTSQADGPQVRLSQDQTLLAGNTAIETLAVGKHAYIHLLTFTPDSPIQAGQRYDYQLEFAHKAHSEQWHSEQQTLLYAQQTSLHFVWQQQITHLIHGSCRKPHHDSDDSLCRVDKLIEQSLAGKGKRPDMLMLTGDQIYADDVAGPMLFAINQVIERLGLFQESIEGALIHHSEALAQHPFGYYQRQKLLPEIATNTALSKLFFGAKKKPIFTSANAQNHLISCAEILAMYLLVWSDTLWPDIDLTPPKLNQDLVQKYTREKTVIQHFSHSLTGIRRALAHLPVYMIFDDHDVTDDWNLTRGWEQEVYGHPLSKRMVGNALIGYWLCQGWGNQADVFTELASLAKNTFTPQGLQQQNAFIDALLNFQQWHFQLNTSPPIHVLDTRTRRWRSESSLNKPSGLMDWEALCEFQQGLIGHDAVIVVSAAPIYGVKFIEVIQKIFTLMGKALTVDAENWMAHKGTASVMLNIFRHSQTPPHFIILSGDVHYSFVYDVRLRFQRNSPKITQFTCSGIKNTFPEGLLRWLDRFNRWLYSPHSPLNIFTRRRNMSVNDRHPGHHPSQTLLNQAAIGQLLLDDNLNEIQCFALCANGERIEFPLADTKKDNTKA
jgi:hypothetical protein